MIAYMTEGFIAKRGLPVRHGLKPANRRTEKATSGRRSTSIQRESGRCNKAQGSRRRGIQTRKELLQQTGEACKAPEAKTGEALQGCRSNQAGKSWGGILIDISLFSYSFFYYLSHPVLLIATDKDLEGFHNGI